MATSMRRVIQTAVEQTENELGELYLEKHYQTVMAHYLREQGCRVDSEVVVAYHTSFGLYIGSGRIDLVVKLNGEVGLLELKAGVAPCGGQKQKAIKQVLRYQLHYPQPCSAHVVFFATQAFKNVYHFPGAHVKDETQEES